MNFLFSLMFLAINDGALVLGKRIFERGESQTSARCL
jgi:hypothetical protein